ncbi:MAG TPA: hypothetical protein VK970_04365, partial [Candidatus Methylacidiphilales bacterium]|nr:hypothetical protein [Candidatus Methylacidiphilales bacterium]
MKLESDLELEPEPDLDRRFEGEAAADVPGLAAFSFFLPPRVAVPFLPSPATAPTGPSAPGSSVTLALDRERARLQLLSSSRRIERLSAHSASHHQQRALPLLTPP